MTFFLCISYMKFMDMLQVPSSSVLPPGSVSLDGAAETQLTRSYVADLPYQVRKCDFN